MNHKGCDTCSDGVNRRDFLRLGGTGVALGLMGMSLESVLFTKAALGVQPENAFYDGVLTIFYNGGPSQTDTWDPKPGSRNNVFNTINLGAKDKYNEDVHISEVFPDIANLVQNDPAVSLGLIRAFWHGSNDHGTGQRYMNTWWRSQALSQQYPSVASAMAYYFQGKGIGIPSVVINGANGDSANMANASRCPTALQVNAGANQGNNPVVQSLQLPPGVDQARYDRRKALLDRLNQRFLASRPDQVARAVEKATEDAHAVTSGGQAARAFDLTGKTLLPAQNMQTAQRMTLAQELLAAGIPYVAVGLGGNDSHSNNMQAVRTIWGDTTNRSVAAMAQNLKATGKRYLILMYGDFGRTPASVANGRDGRDHWGGGFSVAMLSVNQPKFVTTAIGSTGPDGLQQWNTGALDPIAPADLGAFVYRSLGIQIGRPDGSFDIPLNGREAPPVDRMNNSDLLMSTFGLV